MSEYQKVFIFINNNISRNNHPSFVLVFLKNKEGKTVKKIEERALFADKNFQDISGLLIGLKEAIRFGAKKILVLTDNLFLQNIIRNGIRENHYFDHYGFFPDIIEMMNNFDEIGVKVVA